MAWGVSSTTIYKIIEGESNFNTLAVGDKGMSRGLVQIHKKYHPDITDEMAFDPDFSINFLASNLAKGRCSWWTVCRNLFGGT